MDYHNFDVSPWIALPPRLQYVCPVPFWVAPGKICRLKKIYHNLFRVRNNREPGSRSVLSAVARRFRSDIRHHRRAGYADAEDDSMDIRRANAHGGCGWFLLVA